MSFRDTMGHSRTKPGGDAAKIAEETAVKSSKRTTGESELGSAIVWDEGISVLEERNQDQPVIDPVTQMISYSFQLNGDQEIKRTKDKAQDSYGRLGQSHCSKTM
jgi:hypothetical protein